jgi:hypothetical protein
MEKAGGCRFLQSLCLTAARCLLQTKATALKYYETTEFPVTARLNLRRKSLCENMAQLRDEGLPPLLMRNIEEYREPSMSVLMAVGFAEQHA